MIQLFLEGILSLLLALTLFHALRLERALTRLRSDRVALEATISAFDANARQTEGAIDRLRGFAGATIREVGDAVEKAGVLRDDLAFLTERGDRLADQLDRLVRQGQAGLDGALASSWSAVNTSPVVSALMRRTDQATSLEPDARGRSKAEQDLLRVLRASR